MKTFQDLELNPSLSKAITELGFASPTPIQAKAIPELIKGQTDFVGLAATGTGKTGAFAIPMLELISKLPAQAKSGPKALILCPTRELAVQVAGQLNLLAKFMPFKTLSIYGGAPFGDQLRALKDSPAIIVGTPGRVLDHLSRKTLKLDDTRFVVLDEADEMISMGFREDLESILKCVTGHSRKWMFSATMSPPVRKIADTYLKNPFQVQINQNQVLPTELVQQYFIAKEPNRAEVLCKLIDAAEDFYGIVFCQTKIGTADLAQYLNEKGYVADCLHGDKDQKAREKTLSALRNKRINILVCTDVAARGIDIKDISHVVNFSLPKDLDSYVHRIGRTARSGKTGHAYSLISNSQKGLIRRLETITKSKMTEGKIPTRKEIGIRQVNQILEAFKSTSLSEKAKELMSEKWPEALTKMTAQEVAARFISISLKDLLSAPEETAASLRHDIKDEIARKPGRDSRGHSGRFSDQRRSGRPLERTGFVVKTGGAISRPAPFTKPKASGKSGSFRVSPLK